MQYILLMDYDYARLYINSLGVQAMVGQLTRIKSKQSNAVPPATLLAMYQPNQKYIREVYLAGRQILMSTLQGLVPDAHLTHASVRTYSRILSGLIFSLKVISCPKCYHPVSLATVSHIRCNRASVSGNATNCGRNHNQSARYGR